MENNGNGRKDSLLEVASRYSGTGVRWLWFGLIVTALLCAACNIGLPLIERTILQMVSNNGSQAGLLGLEQREYLMVFLGVTIASFVLLAIENFINIRILYLLRRALEEQILRNLATHKSNAVKEKGAGAFSSSVTGDANQVASMMAANYFAMFINLASAIVSIIISATWYLPFLIIVGVSYAVIILIVLVFNTIEVSNYRKGQEYSYQINPKIVELLETHDSILNNVNYMQYLKSIGGVFRNRDKKQEIADTSVKLRATLVKMVQGVALAVFLIYSVPELSEPTGIDYATFTALIAYMTTIFLPVDSLADVWTSRNKFHAFYRALRDYLESPVAGILPQDSTLHIKHMSLEENEEPIAAGFDFRISQNMGVVGMSSAKFKTFAAAIMGDKIPSNGQVLLGDSETYKIRKNLVMSMLRYSSNVKDCYQGNLEYNVTMGKILLSDADYEETKQEYLLKMNDFLFSARQGKMFDKSNKRLTRTFLADFLAMDRADYRNKDSQKDIMAAFNSILKMDEFIAEVGPALFAQKYAKRSRYEALVSQLGLLPLRDKDFGPRGSNVSEGEEQLVVLARFLLSCENSPYILREPGAYLDPITKKNAMEVLRRYMKDPAHPMKGLVYTEDLEILQLLTDSIIAVDENGKIEAVGAHSELLKLSPTYKKLWRAYNNLGPSKKKEGAGNEGEAK